MNGMRQLDTKPEFLNFLRSIWHKAMACPGFISAEIYPDNRMRYAVSRFDVRLP